MAGSRGSVVANQIVCASCCRMRLPKSPETVTLVALGACSRKVTVRSVLTTGDCSREMSVEEVGVTGCGVKVAVSSEVPTGKVGTAEFVDEAGFVEKDAGLAGAQACRNVVRHNMTRPDRSCLMKVPWNWLETLPERRQGAAPSRG